MFVPDVKLMLGAAMMLVPSLTCVAPRETPEPLERAGGVRAEVGEARQPLCFGLTITNVLVLPETFHWEDAAHLLRVAEGFGPRTLSVSVSTSVTPAVRVLTTSTPIQPAASATGSRALNNFWPFPAIPHDDTFGDFQPSPGIPGSGSLWGSQPSSGMPGSGSPWGSQPSSGMPGSGSPWGSQPSSGMPGSGSPWGSQPSSGMPGSGSQPSAGTGGSGSQPSSGMGGDNTTPGAQPASGPLNDCVPSNEQISKAVGFDVSATVGLDANTVFFVPTAALARVSAYPVYQQYTWDIVSTVGWSWDNNAAETAVVGSGIAYRPIGVYFDTDLIYDLAAIGGGLIDPGPYVNPGSGAGGAGNGSTPGADGGGGADGNTGGGGAGATGGAGGASAGTTGSGAGGADDTGGTGGAGGPWIIDP
jgi:hypothetical protein